MAYRIVYGPEPKKKGLRRNQTLRLRILTAFFLLAFVIGVKQLWPEGVQKLRTFLIPGEASATEQAVQSLITDLQHGEDFSAAVTVFCRQIIENGQVG